MLMTRRLGRLGRRLRGVRRKARHVWSNPGNSGRVMRQWWGVLRFEMAALRGRTVVLPFASSSRVRCRKAGDSSQRVPFAVLPDWPEMPIWKSVLQAGDLFVDVGANVGLYSLLASESGARVVCVEPASDMADALEENLSLNGVRTAEVHRVALLDRTTTVTFGGPDPNRRRVAVTGSAGDQRRSVVDVVSATTLDDLLAGRVPRGMKIDVEGVERLVLEGAAVTLALPAVEIVQLEWNSTSQEALGEDRSPVARLLSDLGFRFFQWDPSSRVLQAFGTETPPYGRDVFGVRGTALELFASWSSASKLSRGWLTD